MDKERLELLRYRLERTREVLEVAQAAKSKEAAYTLNDAMDVRDKICDREMMI